MKKSTLFLCVLIMMVFVFTLPVSATVDLEPIGGFGGKENACISSFAVTLAESETTEFAGGTGTENDPYLIETKVHLNNVRNYPDAHFKMTKDIAFTKADFLIGGAFYNGGAGWKPIGTHDNTFGGVFDGDGHTIIGLSVNDNLGCGGLFGYSDGTIKNIGLIDCKVFSTLTSDESLYVYCGGIVGSSDGFVLNCYVTGSVNAQKSWSDQDYVYCGGVIGYNGGVVKDSHNSGNVIAQADHGFSYAGGIAGANGSSDTIENLYNTGEIISISENGTSSAAGISGYNTGKIRDSYNNGDISGGQFAAGIANAGNVSYCYNTGTVISNEHSGGIIAYGSRSSVGYCYNDGSIFGGNAGGIVGFLEQATVMNCYNTGDISVYESASIANIGGIAGCNWKGTVFYCYNVGSLTPMESSSSKYVGGIVGKFGTNSSSDHSAIVKNSYYLDNVKYLVGSGTDSTGKLTVAEMKVEDSFSTFDFNNVWRMDPISGYSYPLLAWQVKEISEISFTETSSLVVESVEGLVPEFDAEIKVIFEDGTFVVVPLDLSMLPDFDMDIVGTQILNVCYRDVICKDTITIRVAERSLQGIEMEVLPEKNTYVKDFEGIDISGGVVALVYNNGTEEYILLTNDMVKGFDLGVEGVQNVTVSYDGFTTDFLVYGVTCESIEVEKSPDQVVYESGQPLDLSGGKIKVYYSNQEIEQMDLERAEIRYDKNAIGTVSVIGTLFDKTFSFDITVTEKKIDSIVVTAPEKVTYIEGQDLDLSGGSLLVNYLSSYNEPEILDLSMDMIGGYDKDLKGIQVITVTYGGKTDTFDVTVIAKEISEIIVSEPPTDIVHAENGTIFMVGGKISLQYNDGSEESVDMTESMLSGYDAKKIGVQSFIVTYAEKVSFFEAEVKHNYYKNEDFAPDCKNRGYTLRSCYCGSSYKDNYIDALGHDIVVKEAVLPTCTKTGLTEGQYCSRCDEKTVEQEEVPALGHNYKTVVTAPTCTVDGYSTYTCACGDSYVKDYVDALGHSYENGICAVCGVVASPYLQQLPENIIGCTNLYEKLTPVKGYYTATKYDTGNGSVISVVIPVEPGDRIAASSFGSVLENMGSVDGIRVTYLQGDKIVTSLSASEVYNEYSANGYITVPHGVDAASVPWWGPSENNWMTLSQVSKDFVVHSPERISAQAPTCTEIGYTEGEICKVCNASLGERKEIPPTGHTYSGNTCSICGAVNIKAILNGKYVSILGDSISTFNGYSNDATVNTTIGGNDPRYDAGTADTKPGSYCLLESVDQSWWMNFANRSGMKLLVNNSWSGSQVFGGKTSDGRVIPAAYLDRCVNLHDDTLENNVGNEPIDPDVIFVYLGINDYNFNRSKVGTDTVDYAGLLDSDGSYVIPTTFGEAYGIMLHKMKNAYPDAQIFVMTLLPENLYSVDKNAWEQHNEYIRAAAGYYNIPVVDLAENCAITWENYSRYMIDKIHPTSAGMRLISDCIDAELHSYYKENLPHIHRYESVVTAPTCTEQGYTTYTCHCGDHYIDDEVPALGHDYKTVVTAPTCTIDGYTTYTCHCGDTYKDNVVTAPGHKYERKVIVPTCTKQGYTTYTCHCGDQYIVDKVPAKGHNWDNGTIIDPPDPITEGKKRFYCKNGCGATYVETLPATGIKDPYFVDVKSGVYYYDAVAWAVAFGVTSGTSSTTFSPDNVCTRSQAVTFLWRAAGKPAPQSSYNPFSDVKSGQYYYDAVLWAVEQGITMGTSATTFEPDTTCNRAQIVTFLYRAEGEPSVAVRRTFSDVKTDVYYAKAVTWAVNNGVTSGTSSTTFSPDNDCTRGQIVTLLYRAQ